MRLTSELEKTLRRYALGQLGEGPRLELEGLLVTDPETLEALGVVEDELTEEYLERTLSTAERRDFERSFLASPDRQRLLGFVGALKSRASTRASGAWPARLAAMADRLSPSRWPPARVGALAALLVLSLMGNVWLGFRQITPEDRPTRVAGAASTATAQAVPSPPGRSAQLTGLSPVAASTPLEELTAENRELRALLEAQRKARSRVPTFALAAGLLRGEGSLARVAVPAGAAGIRLRLELPQAGYGQYRATLRDPEGEEVWTAAKLRPEEGTERVAVVLVLPSEILSRGDYQIHLSGVREDGEVEALASYAFRVTRE